MRAVLAALSCSIACSGEPSPDARAVRGDAEGATAVPAAQSEDAGPARVASGQAVTQGELAPASDDPEAPAPAVDPRQSGDAPPDAGNEIGPQPDAPTTNAAPPQDPNLDPEHLEHTREQAMTDAEKRAARARAARHAYEQ